MKIERLKSILLIILVISSIVLTANKWFSKELWPGGYSFVSSFKKHFSLSQDKVADTFDPNREVLKPAKIIINNLNNHVLLTKSSPQFDGVFTDIKDILSKAFTSKDKTSADMSEWNNNLKSGSLYFGYPVMYDASYFASQLSKTYTGDIKHFKEFVVANDQVVPSVMYVYIKDAETDAIEKTKINFESETLSTLINRASSETGDINYYSFELNFDSADNNGVEEHVVIDHDVLINISEKQAHKISEINSFDNIASNSYLYSQVLAQFKYNTSNIRKYVESDDSMVFVENYGTLKLSSNGLLSYESVDGNKGIDLNTSSAKNCLNSCITFVNNVSSLIDSGSEMYCEISSDIHDITGLNFTLTFDYYINDNTIIIPEEKYGVKNAVTVKVSNGRIVSYNQVFVSFVPSNDTINCGSAIDAIDRLGTADGIYPDTISDIFVAYNYAKEENAWYPMWYIEDSAKNISMISNKAEV